MNTPYHIATSNKLVDDGQKLLDEVDREENITTNQYKRTEEARRIALIAEPNQRLKEFLLSSFCLRETTTYEASQVKAATTLSFFSGFLVGVTKNSAESYERYRRIYNAELYSNRYRAERHRLSTLLLDVGERSLRWGLRFGLAGGSIALITYGSYVYRHQSYYPDILVGSSIVGAISRTWLGPRAMFAGAIIASLFGTMTYFYVGSVAFLFKSDNAFLKEMQHNLAVARDEQRHRNLLKIQEEMNMKTYEKSAPIPDH